MYELTYIINPISGELDINAATAKIRSFVTDQMAGEIKKEYISEKKRLSFPVKKQSGGFYATIEFQAEPEKIDELKKFLELDNDVLRHLILNIDEKTQVKHPARIRPSVTALPESEIGDKTAKAKIEELDKKLEELLK